MTRIAPTSLALLLFALASPARAQNADAFSWANQTELSFVSTAGNASSNTLGLKSALTGTGGPNSFKLELGGVRASSGITTRTATGTPSSFTVQKTTESKVTAASYYARARYDRTLDGAFAFGGAGWERNTFAGVANRYSGVVGLGRTFVDGPSGHFKSDIGVTYTVQKDVEKAPGVKESFVGGRLSVDALRNLSESAAFTSTLTVDENAEETKDLRGDWTNSVAVSITQGLAFKTSLELLFDNQPAFVAVPLIDGTTGQPTGTNVAGRGQKLDSVLTLSLVIKL
jgi:putative salt-induced outer membrane protein YdiY